jgi:hypothetical protein
MLELNKKRQVAPPSRRPRGRQDAGATSFGKLAPSELDRLEREIAAADQKIDELVYELYGITKEERKIIEGPL